MFCPLWLSWTPCFWWHIQWALTSQPCPLSPLQGQELTIRQISLLGFRDLVLLKVKLGDLLLLARSQPPSSIVQMLLVLQVGEAPLETRPPGRGRKRPCGTWEGPNDLSTRAQLLCFSVVVPVSQCVCSFARPPRSACEAPGAVLHAGIPVGRGGADILPPHPRATGST